MSSDMKNTADPIRKRKLSDHVQDRLLAIIQNGELSPGDTLPSERELMASYSVGRPAIREAMQNLQRMGIVVIRHGERPKIAEPSFDSVVGQLGETMLHLLTHSSASLAHLKEAREVLEKQLVRIAAERRTPEDIERLKVILANQHDARPDIPEFLLQDGLFHQEIGRISGNPIFEGLIKSFFEWMTHFNINLVRMPGHSGFTPSEHELTLIEHKKILDAIESGDADDAENQLSEHLKRANALYHKEHLQNSN